MNKVKKLYYFIRLYISVINFDIKLRRKGFEYLLPIYENKYTLDKQIFVSPSKIYEEIDEFLKLIWIVCSFYPLKAKCLHRTFVAYGFIRKKFGINVNIVIGVRKFPFSAHAWLTYNGVCINDMYENISKYNVILSSNN